MQEKKQVQKMAGKKENLLSKFLEWFFGKEKKKKEEKPVEKKPEKKPEKPEKEVEKKPAKKIRKRKTKKILPAQVSSEAIEWQKKTNELKEQIVELSRELKKKKELPEHSTEQIQVIYGNVVKEKEDIDSEIRETKYLLKKLEHAFFKREISAEHFERKMFEYRERLNLLEFKKNEMQSQIKEVKKIQRIAMPMPAETSARPQKIQVRQEKEIEQIQEPQKELIEPRAMTETSEKEATTPKIKARLPAKEGPKIEKEIQNVLEEKTSGKIDDEKLREMEEKIGLLMDKYSVPKEEVAKKLEGIDANKVIDSFNKLVELIESEHKTGTATKEAAPKMPVQSTESLARELSTIPLKQKPGERGTETIAMELKEHLIVTDFDRILSEIKKTGKIEEKKLAEKLKIDAQRMEACCKILEKNNLIKVIYPPIGGVLIQDLEFVEKKKERKPGSGFSFFPKKREEKSEKK